MAVLQHTIQIIVGDLVALETSQMMMMNRTNFMLHLCNHQTFQNYSLMLALLLFHLLILDIA